MRQTTRQGWPYYTRRLHKPYDTSVSRRATPGGWPAAALSERLWGHPLPVACIALALASVTAYGATLYG
jgi:hypothetical protein